MKKSIALFLLLILGIATLTACGGNQVDPNDPKLGKWNAVSVSMMGITMDIEEAFENETSFELKANGSCAIDIDGEKGNGKWTFEGDEITIKGGGAEFNGTIKNGIMTLEESDTGMEITFKK